MKKLITMIGVAAAAFGLYADEDVFAPSAISAEKGELYEEGTSVLEQDGWYMAEDADDAAVVKAYGEETAPDHTALYAASPDAVSSQLQYVGLDSEAPVFRTFAPVNGLGGMDSVAIETAERGGIIADQLVKFSAFDADTTVELADGAKIAVWLKTLTEGETEAENTYALMATCGALKVDTFDPEETTVQLDLGNLAVKPGEWHQLTITAIKALKLGDDGAIPGFKVEVDGVLAKVADGEAKLFPEGWDAIATDEAKTLVTAEFCKLLPSAVAWTSTAAMTLQGIAYKGSGAVDDITIKAKDPFASSTTINVALAEGVTAVAEPGEFDNEKGTWTFPKGTETGTITLTAPKGKLFKSNGKDTLVLENVDLTDGDLDYSAEEVDDAVAQIGSVLYLTLNAAFEAAVSGETIEMIAATAEITEAIKIQGKTLTLTGTSVITANRAFNLFAGANLTIDEDITISGTGATTPIFLWPYVSDVSANPDPAEYAKATLTVDGTVTYSGTGSMAAITSNGNDRDGGVDVIINGTVMNSVDSALYLPGKGTLTVNDGAYIEGTYAGVQMKSVAMTVNGGTIKATGVDQTPTALYSNGAKASGCAIQMEGNTAYAGGISLVVKGGVIESTNAKAIYAYGAQEKFSTISIEGGIIKGNTGVFLLDEGMNKAIVPGTSQAQFNQDVSDFCEEGFETVKLDGDDYYTVQKKASDVVTPDEPIGLGNGGDFESEAEAQAAADKLDFDIDEADKDAGLTKEAVMVKAEFIGGAWMAVLEPKTAPVVDETMAVEVTDTDFGATVKNPVPGVFYGFVATDTLDGTTPFAPVGDYVRATSTDETLKLTAPKSEKGNACFYKLNAALRDPTKK